jgi:hypothetical protein
MLVQMYNKAKSTKKTWYATSLIISDPNPTYAKSPNWEKCQVCAGESIFRAQVICWILDRLSWSSLPKGVQNH